MLFQFADCETFLYWWRASFVQIQTQILNQISISWPHYSIYLKIYLLFYTHAVFSLAGDGMFNNAFVTPLTTTGRVTLWYRATVIQSLRQWCNAMNTTEVSKSTAIPLKTRNCCALHPMQCGKLRELQVLVFNRMWTVCAEGERLGLWRVCKNAKSANLPQDLCPRIVVSLAGL